MRRASRMPAAGISGSTERALMVQFTKPVKMNVPKTQSSSKQGVGVLVFPCVGGRQCHHGESRRDEERQLNADREPVPIKVERPSIRAETDSAGS